MEQDNQFIERGAHKGKCIAVFTSGGDSQGMNAALRAVVRVGIYLGCKVFFIREGYQGMVDGGEYIVEATWQSVSGIIHKGGTIIGSARCQDFRERKGRLRAAYNLIKHSITNLVIIGGDGSLTGAALFQQEWPSLVAELASSGKQQQYVSSVLNIVGLVGSIDNDFCGTDMTIGTDSALHRIVEAVDAIASTADSHRRTFIMEVMGRHCGYLALVGGLCCGADYVFIPEQPEDAASWRDSLCDKLTQERASGQRLNIIIVSEGAVDNTGAPITAEQVREVVVARLNQDARVTVLGHVQRGGSPSSFDRVLACRMGAEAVLALLEEDQQLLMKEGGSPWVITLDGNHISRQSLASLVARTQAVALAMSQRRWEEAVALRGRSFARNLDTFKMLTRLRPPPPAEVAGEAGGIRMRRRTLAVMHVGAPACGMNAAVRSFVRSALYRSGEVDKVLGIQDGVEGLLSGDASMVRPLAWEDVSGGWVAAGGANLGTKRTLPGDRVEEVLAALRRHNITGLLIVGGFEAFRAALQLSQQPPTTTASQSLHLVVIPCTISNNVPGTDFSLGSDTALNEITAACDRIRQSAQGTKRRVFVVETQGGYCGYLATVAALGSGADTAYIHEEPARIDTLHADLRHIASKMERMATVQRGLVLRNERSSDNYNTDFLHRLYAEEGKGLFSTRINVLGHIQQGGSPSPFDRNMATKMACKSVEWLLRQPVEGATTTTAVLLGIVTNQYTFTPLEELLLETNTDFQYRLPKQQWWLRLRPLLRILARHDSMEEQRMM